MPQKSFSISKNFTSDYFKKFALLCIVRGAQKLMLFFFAKKWDLLEQADSFKNSFFIGLVPEDFMDHSSHGLKWKVSNMVWRNVTTSDVTIFVFAQWRDVTKKIVFLLWRDVWRDDLARGVTLFLDG